MKKLFVSIPMKGRTASEIRENILKMKKLAEVFEGEELDLIDRYVEDNPPENIHTAVWYLGESLKKLSKADVFIGINCAYNWHGCDIEERTAYAYGIKMYSVPAQYVIDNFEKLLNRNTEYNERC